MNDRLVSGIGANVFRECQYLEKVTFPSSLRLVGNNAFELCEALKIVIFTCSEQLTLKSGSFANCSSLERIDLPSIAILEDFTFNDCGSLSEIRISNQSSVFVSDCIPFVGCVRLRYENLPPEYKRLYRLSNYDGNHLINVSELFKNVQKFMTHLYEGKPLTDLIPPYDDEYDQQDDFYFEDSSLIGDSDERRNLEEDPVNHLPILISIDDFFNFLRGISLTKRRYELWVNKNIPDGDKKLVANAFREHCNGAYEGNANLRRLFFSSNVKCIGTAAFADCEDLTEIVFNEGLEEIRAEAFWRCKIKSLKLPKSLKSIGSKAFSNCERLDQICIQYESGQLSIDSRSFSETRLKELILSGRCVGNPFARDSFTQQLTVIISEGVREIEKDAFKGCKWIKKVVLPRSLRIIGPSAFEDCINLSEVVFDSNAENSQFVQSELRVEDNAFKGCCGIEKLKLPANFNPVGSRTFADCDNLSEVSFDEGYKIIGEKMFERCACLGQASDLIFPESLETMGDSAFEKCSSLISISFKKGLNIGSGAFVGCTCLKSVSFEDIDRFTKGSEGTFSVGAEAFKMCRNLEKIELSDSFKRIETSAFLGCVNLKSVRLSLNLALIGPLAFLGCQNLEKLELPKKIVSDRRKRLFRVFCFGNIGSSEERQNIGNVLLYRRQNNTGA